VAVENLPFLCQQLINNEDLVVVCSADNYFTNLNGQYNFDASKQSEAHKSCLVTFNNAVQRKKDLIVVDNTNTTVAEVAPYAALALAYGYELEVIILEVDKNDSSVLGKMYRRNVHGVPEGAIYGQYNRLLKLASELPPWWKVTRVPVEY
jgi:hypothetical protein